jgi:hypothetical protein
MARLDRNRCETARNHHGFAWMRPLKSLSFFRLQNTFRNHRETIVAQLSATKAQPKKVLCCQWRNYPKPFATIAIALSETTETSVYDTGSGSRAEI